MLDGLQAEGETRCWWWRLADELRGLVRIRQGLREGRPMTQLLRDNRVGRAPAPYRTRLAPPVTAPAG